MVYWRRLTITNQKETLRAMASIRRHPNDRSWQVRYRDPAGTQQTKAFTRQVDAKAFAADVESDKRRGSYIDPQAGNVTFAEYAKRWQQTRRDKAQATRDRDASYLRSMVLPTFANLPLRTITTSQIASWLANLDRADATRAKALQIVRNIFELARQDRAIGFNPAADVSTPTSEPERVGRALNDAEVAAILDAAEAVDETTAAMVWAMVRAGLRVGEAIALHRSDVDLTTGMLNVRRSMNRSGELVPVKGRRRQDQGRRIPIPADLTERLGRHLASSRLAAIDGFLFTAPRGGPISYARWRQRTWSRIVDTAGVDARPHDLRRTCATRLIVEDRWSPAEVQAFLGHRDPRVTLAIYTMISADELPTPSSIAT